MIFLNSASSAAALVFYLPVVCTHADTEGKQRKARVRNILKSSKKHNIFSSLIQKYHLIGRKESESRCVSDRDRLYDHRWNKKETKLDILYMMLVGVN